jgi:SAM-dependent methyltransferase
MKPDPAGQPPLEPSAIFDTLTAFWKTSALKAGLDLDLFTRIGQGLRTRDELARAAGASPRGVAIIADALCGLGFLAKEDGRYSLPPVAEFLRSDSPAFLGGFHRFLTSEYLWTAFGRVTEAARAGRSQIGANALTPENPAWQVFAESTAASARAETPALVELARAKRPGLRILDVASGSGEYGISVARESQGARLTYLDWPNVLQVALRHAAAAGLKPDTIPGDALQVDWGGPHDVIVASHFLHHFNPEDCRRICRKARAALAPEGVFITQEFVPDEGRAAREEEAAGGPFPLLFAVTMLVTTDEGNAYTLGELRGFLADAGLRVAGVRRSAVGPSTWIAARA